VVSTGQIGATRAIAIKPTTYMNLSGEAVRAVVNFYKLSNENVTVVHDELDIDFGQIRLRIGGAPAGHNGIKSVSQAIGEDYGRIRIGVGPKKPTRIKSEDYILQKFSEAEQEQLANLKREVASILSELVYGSQLPTETRSFLV
jgi:PTH1 family peptidyl-tRNA hydrolase